MKIKYTVEITVGGDNAEDEAAALIDHVLDSGVFQDAINEFAGDQDVDVKVTSVVLLSTIARLSAPDDAEDEEVDEDAEDE